MASPWAWAWVLGVGVAVGAGERVGSTVGEGVGTGVRVGVAVAAGVDVGRGETTSGASRMAASTKWQAERTRTAPAARRSANVRLIFLRIGVPWVGDLLMPYLDSGRADRFLGFPESPPV